jgi:outer membrane protein TolC
MRFVASRIVGLIVVAFVALYWPQLSWPAEAADSPPLLTLDEAIQIAIANNRSLKIASLDVDKSKWQVAAAKTHRLPTMNAYLLGVADLTSPTFSFKQGTFGYIGKIPIPTENTNIPLSQGPTGYALAQVAQPLSQLYKIHLFIREQQLSSDLASQEYRGKRQSVVSDVKEAYYAVLQTESALDAAKTTVTEYQETDRVALEYISQEAVLKSESLEVKAKLAQSQHEVVVLEDNLETQKEHLNDLLGRDLETDFRTEPVPPVSPEETNLKLAQQTALSQRPEIKEAEINVQRADYDRKLAKAQYIPDVAATFQYFTPINTQILPQNIASAGGELNWEVFEWGRRKDEVNQKKVTLDQSRYQLKEAQSKVVLDVNNRFRKLEESRSLLAVAQAARDAADEKLREVNDKFKQKAVLLRDVLQQQAAVANADHDYEQALLSFWSAKAEFEKALGEE